MNLLNILSTSVGNEWGNGMDLRIQRVNNSPLSFDANVSSFSLAESSPRDLQITAYK